MINPITWIWTAIYTYQINWKNATIFSLILFELWRRMCAARPWFRPWLTRGNKLGVDNTLLQEFRLEEYKTFLRMTPDNFNELLAVIETICWDGYSERKYTFTSAIPAKIKLAATLQFLATESNYAEEKYKGDLISQRLCSSLYIATNKPFIEFNFFLILPTFYQELLKTFQSLVFHVCNISTFDVFPCKNEYPNLAHECEISDNNRKNLNETSNFSAIKWKRLKLSNFLKTLSNFYTSI